MGVYGNAVLYILLARLGPLGKFSEFQPQRGH